MASGLNRDLGLAEVVAISIGAMVGSGIFILPALAYEIAGPTVVLAYVLAGLLVIPAALSKSEMATAMPEDGGTYVYIERGMGPLLGTVAGIGTWFSLSFKGALALVGGVPYLLYVIERDLTPETVTAIALGIAVLLILLNVVGSDVTGRFQVGIVAVMLAAMVWFVVGSGLSLESTRLEGALDPRSSGLLVATGAVFVSYAGVTKIASVAEEIENPSRNIPLGMLVSLAFTTLLYVLVVAVLVGVTPADVLTATDAPVAVAAEQTLGTIGVVAVVAAALLALVSTANAGVLSASRYPFAMARDDLVPSSFEELHPRFNTPLKAITLTGAVILVLIAFVPILQIAKLASAFQVLVFVLVNLSVIGFREGAVDDYDPDFVSPLYPWLQLAGIVGGLVVLATMGTVPFVGAMVITAGAMAWYYAYARRHIDREGAARAGVRENVSERALERTEKLFGSDAEYDVLVAITDDTSPDARRDMLRMATDMGWLRSTTVSVVEFVDVPHRLFAEDHPDVFDDDVPTWLPTSGDDAPSWFPEDHDVHRPVRPSGGTTTTDRSAVTDARIEYREVDTEDHNRAIVDFATYGDYDLLVAERDPSEFHQRLFGSDTDWLLENAPCDVLLVEDDGFDDADEIAVVANRGAYDPLKLLFADAVAEETGAQINLLQAIPERAPERQREQVERYHETVISTLTVAARSTIIETDDEVTGLSRFVGDADLLVTGVDRTGLTARLLGRPGNRLVDAAETTAVMIQTHDGRQPGLVQRLLMNHLFS
ncbi:amino acid permease [Natronobacterium gregoryi]|uniref:Amino acid permease n=2 Tax=Natronobacterium gregoryi TaxID=44930 RepID=L0AMA9_NATGS|nr:amino acid permease [Natronobacterium gregoryi]AFZ74170.1 amino acid transporter [Natronobacterium gregoryi SP2]ELY63625.1 amino acid permease-associated protein [Natronobacterium gregoryi SP2]PLK22037.1 amino acid permease [Natronobacterium gregoryi SP2]SFI50791.1 amino acid/polyamine/organocation transporter, APC superfamily [Natronobacterium gregoryi]